MQLSLIIHKSDIENCKKKKRKKKRNKKYYYDNTFCLLSFYMINVKKFLVLFFYFFISITGKAQTTSLRAVLPVTFHRNRMTILIQYFHN